LQVAKESGYVTPEDAPQVIGYAEAQARALLSAAKAKGYTGN
jgi:predicted transcriptional regulator of viral defense system